MSYNVTQWKTKEIEQFEIPIDAFYIGVREDCQPDISVSPETGLVGLSCMDSRIEGFVVGVGGSHILAREICIVGEGSGFLLGHLFEPAFSKSTGRMVAVRIWEGGDSIDKITVDNGVITTEKVEL